MYRVTKTYGHELGLSTCFRQPLAQSHCRFLHGYPMSFEFIFESETLNLNNWVTDFGGLKPLKAHLCDTYDHRTLIAKDDPFLHEFERFHELGLIDLLVVPAIGCEAFARMEYDFAATLIRGGPDAGRVRVVSCEAREHGGNSATYIGDR